MNLIFPYNPPGGTDDRVAPAIEVSRLGIEASGGKWPVLIIPSTGHNCVFEEPRVWRDAVMKFLG